MQYPVVLEPHEPIAVVFRREAFALFPFVLKHTFVKVSSDADVERVAAACHDVCEIAIPIHRWNRIPWQLHLL